jgi:hypothetical protein
MGVTVNEYNQRQVQTGFLCKNLKKAARTEEFDADQKYY